MSIRLVMPMSRMLLSASTPSIFVRSWLTMESCTPVPSRTEPRLLQMASISSKMMMCRSESSPFAVWSASASLKRFLMFSSAWPTYLERISGPLTILGSLPLSILPIWRAMSVLPVPGGPCSSMPFTCEMPSCDTTDAGNTREANARLKMSPNCLSRPPMPSLLKLNSLRLNRLLLMPAFWPVSLMPVSLAASKTTAVASVRTPRVAPSSPPARAMPPTANR
mmetsp:Transcript_8123/g.32940  ORF Transcript_8123/g.32940 Transcript_8123/m.32940 type:complete len:222 (+) Transcript_8123:1177-1842(+)